MGTLPIRGAAVLAAVGQVGARFIDKDEMRTVFLGQGLEKRLPQGYDPFAVAFGGVDAFFLRPQPSCSTARQVLVRLSAGPPRAANSVRNSSNVASGCCTRQAVNSRCPASVSSGVRPPLGGRLATEPLVRCRCKSLSTKETETLKQAATS